MQKTRLLITVIAFLPFSSCVDLKDTAAENYLQQAGFSILNFEETDCEEPEKGLLKLWFKATVKNVTPFPIVVRVKTSTGKGLRNIPVGETYQINGFVHLQKEKNNWAVTDRTLTICSLAEITI